MFGVESSVEQPEIRRDVLRDERRPVREFAKVESRQRERGSQKNREAARESDRAPPRQASVWDALDEIGREQGTPQEQSVSSEAMARIQERTAEHKQERETAETERQKIEREKQEREHERDIGLGFSR